MKRAAFDRDRPPGAAVLRRVDEPIEKEPSQSPQMKLADNNKPAECVPKAVDKQKPPIAPQDAQPAAGTSNARSSAKWTYHEERFFFEYLRMIKGMQIRDDCVTSIATALRTKDAKQVGTYYDNIVTSMKRHLNTNIKKESSLENLHYTMVVYWERVMLPATETKYNRSLKSKDSKGDTNAKKGSLATATVAQQSTGKMKTKKHKTAASTHAPGNGTSNTPTQSICIEEEDQNQAILPPPPSATTGPTLNNNTAAGGAVGGAVASSGPLPTQLIKLRLVAASSIYLDIMQKHQYTGASCMKLPAHTSLVDMLSQLESAWQRALVNTTTVNTPTSGVDGVKRCSLYLQAGQEASVALQGVKWGGHKCNPDLTIGDVVSLMPSPREDGELLTLYYSWDITKSSTSGEEAVEGAPMNELVAGAAAVINDQQQDKEKEEEGKQVNGENRSLQGGIAPALPGEDAHSALRKAIKAALDQKKLQLAAAAAAAATAAAPALAPAEKNRVACNDNLKKTNKNTTTEQAPQLGVATIGQKRQRSALEEELEAALTGVDGDGDINMDGNAGAIGGLVEQQQQQQATSGVVEGDERPAQRSRVPVGLRNLLKTAQPAPGAAAAAAPPAAAPKAKAKKSPKKKAAANRRNRQQQQQQQQMHAVLQQPAPYAVPGLAGGMPLPAGMANYLQWPPANQAQAAQVLQGQHQAAPLVQYAVQQQHPLYANQMQPQQQQQQYQQTPLAMGQPPRPPQPLTTAAPATYTTCGAPFTTSPPEFMQGQGLTDGMNSLFGDSMFKSLFETPRSNHQAEQRQQQQAQQQQERPAATTAPSGAQKETETAIFGAYNTPAKELRTSPLAAVTEEDAGGQTGNTLSRKPLDWACLSPPANFKLPADFDYTGGGGASLLGGIGGGGGGHSLLPSTSLLGFMDAHPKAQGAAATVMQQGVEALFQQITAPGGGGGDGAGVDDEALAAEAAAGGVVPPTDTSLHSIDSLLEKSNSNWLAPFATAQGAATNTNTGTAAAGEKEKKRSDGGGGGQQEDVPPVCNRPFAALFGN